MRKGFFSCAASLSGAVILFGMMLAALAGCDMENDMMVPKDVAGFETFEIKNQISTSINTSRLTITVTMPLDSALNRLEISNIKYTDVTRNKVQLFSIGDVIDLSDTLRVTLEGFRTFDWKLVAVNAEAESEETQLYNMSFDNWCQEGKGWFPYASDADDAQKAVWTTANKGTSDLIGKNTTIPEESFLAVSGEGKKAAKLSSEYYLVKFASGNIFTGEFCGLRGTKGADLAWGIPFTARPKALCGYYCYQPGTINYSDDKHKDLIGQTDIGQIQIILADWDKNKWDQYPDGAIDEQGRFHVVNSDEQFIDYDNDPAIIGYANFVFNEWMDGYKYFEMPITYRSDRTPSVVAIVSASSRYGDYFTGATGTVLYLDEFSFQY